MPVRSLKAKSLKNIESADLLIENKFFGSSVHCSYYSCLQLIKIVLSERTRFNLMERENSRESHITLINKFQSLLEGESDEVETHTNNVKKLKELRVRADYDPYNVGERNCQMALTKAKIFRDFVFNEIKIN